MKVKLLRDCRPFGRTGDTIEVSPENSDWLLSLGMAIPVTEVGEQAEAPKKAEKPAEKSTAKKTTKTSAKK